MEINTLTVFFSALFNREVNNDRYFLAHTVSVPAGKVCSKGRHGYEGKMSMRMLRYAYT